MDHQLPIVDRDCSDDSGDDCEIINNEITTISDCDCAGADYRVAASVQGCTDDQTVIESNTIIPPDAVIDSIPQGSGRTFRWRWYLRNADGSFVILPSGGRARKGKYIRFLNKNELKTLKRYFRDGKKLRKQIASWARADHGSGANPLCADSSADGVNREF